jgi:bifunctional UDP-N-acetylglucosamine pyrophosphorylase/glucosamine-1-phosphate N-acetyltransferase
MKNTEVIVLAAGHGKRMESTLPKVLVPLKGTPLVMHVLKAINRAKICKKPIVVVGQQRKLVMHALGKKFTYAIQKEQKGTGNAVLSAKKTVNKNAKRIVVLYGDHPFITANTIKKLAKKSAATGAKIIMATVHLKNFSGPLSVFYQSFSRIIRNQKGEIVKDVQFKDATKKEKEVTEVNPCYFCFETNWLWKNLKKLKTNNVQHEYYLTDLVKIAMQEKEKIDSIEINLHEALGANSKNELEILEGFKI